MNEPQDPAQPSPDPAAHPDRSEARLQSTLLRIRDACQVFVATDDGTWSTSQSQVFRERYGESSGELLRYNLGALGTALSSHPISTSPEAQMASDVHRAYDELAKSDLPLNEIALKLYPLLEGLPQDSA